VLLIVNTWLDSTRECRDDREIVLVLGSDHMMSLASTYIEETAE